MSRRRYADPNEPQQPFLVRHLPFILTMLFIVALHQPLARGLAPQIEYVTALVGGDAVAAETHTPRSPDAAPRDRGILIEAPVNHSVSSKFSI